MALQILREYYAKEPEAEALRPRAASPKARSKQALQTQFAPSTFCVFEAVHPG